MIATKTRKTIDLNELLNTLAAAELLHQVGQISSAKLKEIKQNVRQDALCYMETYSGSDSVQCMLNQAYRLAGYQKRS